MPADKTPEYLLRELIATANKELSWVLECLGDKRTPDGKNVANADIVEQMLDDASILLQRIDYLKDIVRKL